MSYKGNRRLDRINGQSLERYIPYFVVILLIRALLTCSISYQIDMAGYFAWSRYLAEFGPSTFYNGSGFHIVYAPFFQYFLWFTGEMANLFKFSADLHIYFIKLWSVLFEILGAWLILQLAKKYNQFHAGAIAALLYLINPGVFMNSSIWGQFDAVPATMLLGTLYLFELKKHNLGAILFLVAVLTKPQSGLLLPIVLYLYFRDFRMDVKSFLRLAVGLVGGIMVYLAIVLPFYQPTALAGETVPKILDPFYWLIDLYLRSLQDYPFATANGYNLWTLLGGQIQKDTLPFMGLTYLMWGNLLLVLAILFIAYMLIKAKGSTESVVYASFLILFSAFLFMTKMHERYLLPAIIFATLSVIWRRRHFWTALLLSACVFANQFTIYLISFQDIYWLDRWNTTANIFALITVFTYILALYQGCRLFLTRKALKS